MTASSHSDTGRIQHCAGPAAKQPRRARPAVPAQSSHPPHERYGVSFYRYSECYIPLLFSLIMMLVQPSFFTPFTPQLWRRLQVQSGPRLPIGRPARPGLPSSVSCGHIVRATRAASEAVGLAYGPETFLFFGIFVRPRQNMTKKKVCVPATHPPQWRVSLCVECA